MPPDQPSTTPSVSTHMALYLLSRSHSPTTAQNLFTEKIRQKPLPLYPSASSSSTTKAGITTTVTPTTTTATAAAVAAAIPNIPNLPAAKSNNAAKVDARTARRLQRLRKKAHYLRKQKPRPLSAKEKRKLGVYDIPKEEVQGQAMWSVYLKLWRLWVEYMWDILGIQPPPPLQKDLGQSGGGAAGGSSGGKSENGPRKGQGQGKGRVQGNHGQQNHQQVINVQNHGNLLATADYHGAKIEVVRSKCAGRVGTKGIVIRDTKFTFVVVLEGGKGVRTIPKDRNVFAIEIPLPPFPAEQAPAPDPDPDQDRDDTFVGGHDQAQDPKVEKSKSNQSDESERKPLRFELYGEHFQCRPAERANRKFKWQSLRNV